ncbi:peptidoglycan binding protein CsiV [Catenovulum sp. 2E275]|uniref:peptidoglycan binding protein CsiV n=1 Tax=Catenovulum sp. 2E275 TaxID=2980497 RepID=UPI0021D210BA|nr:peptidoglycan binding protein CsiV [Catenovulum sp. 2E275]MCU4676689.1 peptidoglycan binding protein CsiV [Catenovulum sp. 2E275]
MTKILKKTLLAAILAALQTPTAFAAERWFEVEMLIFKRNDANTLIEDFDSKIHTISVNKARDLISPTYQPDNSSLRKWLAECEQAVSVFDSHSLATPTSALSYKASVQPPTLVEEEASVLTYNDIQSLQNQTADNQISPKQALSLLNKLQPEFDIEALTFSNAKPSWHYDFSCINPAPGLLNPDYKKLTALEIQTRLPRLPVTVQRKGDAPVSQAYLLTEEELKFNTLKGKIGWRDDMSPLLHIGWRQPVKAKSQEKPWRLFAGENYTGKFNYKGEPVTNDSQADNQTAEELPLVDDPSQAYQKVQQNIQQLLTQIDNNNWVLKTDADTQKPELKTNRSEPEQVWQFDGLFKIYVNHYLYIETEFNIREVTQMIQKEDTPNLQSENNNLYLYPFYFKQNKRIISGEVHYFDHPKMGIVLQVRKYSPE